MQKEKKFAQIDPPMQMTVFTRRKWRTAHLKGNKKYVFIFNVKTNTYDIELYWWFTFKNWLRKLI